MPHERAVILAALAACGTPFDSCPNLINVAVTPAAAPNDVAPILARACAVGGCHLAAPGAGELVIASPAALVGVRSHEAPGTVVVAPGDPDASWLVHKLDGAFCGAVCAGGCGAQMPIGMPLSEADRDAIVAWIIAL